MFRSAQKVLFLLIIATASFSPSLFAEPSLPKLDQNPKAPIQIHGDTVEYFQEGQKAVGTGHVSIEYDDVKLTADKITVYTTTKVATAEGNVTLAQKGSVFTGESVEYNFDTKVGSVSKMKATVEPSYYAKAKSVERVSDDHYRFVDSYVSTCCGDNPVYKVQAHQVDIYPGEKVVARNAVLYVKNVPILFIPYFVVYNVDFERFPVQLIPGKNSEWGAFLLSKWRYHLVESQSFSSKGNVLLDYREKRGFAGGVENFYHGDKVGHGAIRTYFINDEAKPSDIDSERYRVQWRHQSKVTQSTTLTTEFNKLSDDKVIKDFFFREEYERDAFPDNYVSLITSKPEYSLSILDRERFDDFVTVVRRSPEVRFDTYNKRFADTPLYLRQEAQFSHLVKEFANISNYDQEVIRLDSKTTASYAGHVGAVSVVPRIATRQTYYSRDISNQEDLGRGTIEPGLDVSTHFYKTYDVYINAFGLDYNQIRHIFTPTMSYDYRPNPTITRTTLYQFDAIDSIDKQNVMRFSFENKLQTKQHAGTDTFSTLEIARIIPSLDYDLHTGNIENVSVDVELRPYTWMGIEGDTLYNTRVDKFDSANLDFFVEKRDMKLAIGQRYVRDESSQTTLQFDWKINREWALRVYERYEFEEKRSREFETTVSKLFEDCYYLDFTYNHRETYGDSFFVVFRLKAFPSASFGLKQSYNSPKASQAPSSL